MKVESYLERLKKRDLLTIAETIRKSLPWREEPPTEKALARYDKSDLIDFITALSGDSMDEIQSALILIREA